MLIDSFKRKITYLRLSLTDRCNLRCRYCMPHGMPHKLDHEEILKYEEFLIIVKAAVTQGVKKVRLTGGEPLTRKGLLPFIHDINNLPEKPDLWLTTNGVLLQDMAESLHQAGIRGVNVSLDSLNRENFQAITGFDQFDQVWQGIETALSNGFDKVKLNVVSIRGINDHEIQDFAALSLKLPLEVRFIEYMPMGQVGFWSKEKFISTKEVMEKITEIGPLTPVPGLESDGPSLKYKLPNSIGSLGFISPISQHFCSACNRIRLTADGKLRLCLHSNKELDLKSAIRTGASQEEINAILRNGVMEKPQKHALENSIHPTRETPPPASNRAMNLIGG